jgi:hypothetical protein
MNATTKTEIAMLGQLSTLPPAARAALVLGSEKQRIDLAELVKRSAGILTVVDGNGRKEAHTAGMALKNTRTAIRGTGKAAREDATAFSKAVIAEEDALIALIEPEESRLFTLRDGYDAAEQERKDAERRAEAQRVQAITDAIAALRRFEIEVVRTVSTAADTQALIDQLTEIEITADIYQERQAAAELVKAEVLASMSAILTSRTEAEAAAAQAQAAREEEARRVAEERQRLAADREAMAKERERAAAAKAAEQAEQDERDRVAAETKRQLDAQQAQIAADRQALADERAAEEKRRAAALAAEQLAAQVRVDHGDALAMYEQFDADRAAAASLATQALPTPEAAPLVDLADAYVEPELTPFEIADFVIDAVAAEFQMDRAAAVERLAAIDFSAYRSHVEAA